MKKLFIILSVFIVASLQADAYVDNRFMTTEQYMMNTGYSKEMAKMIGIVGQDPYREPQVSEKGKFWDRVYNYVAPGVNTDLDFYNHNINFEKPNWKDY